jgi:predicted dehydrogenase
MSEPVRTAIVGAGHWGPNLIRNFHSSTASVVKMVVDRDGGRLEQIQARFPGIAVAQDAEAVWRDPPIEAVVIATPTSTHFALAKAALESGKHVLVEKPMASRVIEADELTALADKLGRILLVGHLFI